MDSFFMEKSGWLECAAFKSEMKSRACRMRARFANARRACERRRIVYILQAQQKEGALGRARERRRIVYILQAQNP